jgi:hypothetical protein
MLDSREKVREDDTWIRAQYADMIQDPNGYDPRRIISGAAQRRIDTARMVSMIGDWRTRKEEEAGPMGGREFKEIVNGLSDMVRTGKEGIATGASAANAVNAVEELKDWTRVYLQKNPNASPAELRLEARKKRDELFKRFNELGSEEAVKKPGASSSRSSSETPAAPDTKSPALDVALKGFNDERTYILNYLGNATLHAPGEIPTWTQRLADIEKKIKAVESLPPAGKHKGKTVVDEETGLKFKSDGKTWSPAR